MGLREQSISSLSLLFSFSAAQVLVGLRMQFIKKIVFHSWACAAGFNNNNNIDYPEIF